MLPPRCRLSAALLRPPLLPRLLMIFFFLRFYAIFAATLLYATASHTPPRQYAPSRDTLPFADDAAAADVSRCRTRAAA